MKKIVFGVIAAFTLLLSAAAFSQDYKLAPEECMPWEKARDYAVENVPDAKLSRTLTGVKAKAIKDIANEMNPGQNFKADTVYLLFSPSVPHYYYVIMVVEGCVESGYPWSKLYIDTLLQNVEKEARI